MNYLIIPQGTPTIVSTINEICLDCADANNLLAHTAKLKSDLKKADEFTRRAQNAEAFRHYWPLRADLFKMVSHVW